MELPRSLARYGFNASTGRYRDLRTGRFVKTDFIVGVITDTIEHSFDDLGALATQALDPDNPFTLRELERAVIIELRNLHVQMTVLGAGGRKNVTPSQWGTLGNVLKKEYKFLRGFMRDIEAGKLSLAQIQSRLNMYGNKIYNSYWNSKATQMQAAGFTEERRVLQPAEHCNDCITLAARGWQPINTLPRPADGSTECLSNCKCIMEFR